MILTGFNYTSFLLEPTVTTNGAGMMLHPRIDHDRSRHEHYGIGEKVGPARYWTKNEITAAASFWRRLADDREPADLRHLWFGGGVGFGRVTPSRTADVAVDVLVLRTPDAPRPEITYYDDGGVAVGGPSHGRTYITVDTTAERVREAARWWESLL